MRINILTKKEWEKKWEDVQNHRRKDYDKSPYSYSSYLRVMKEREATLSYYNTWKEMAEERNIFVISAYFKGYEWSDIFVNAIQKSNGEWLMHEYVIEDGWQNAGFDNNHCNRISGEQEMQEIINQLTKKIKKLTREKNMQENKTYTPLSKNYKYAMIRNLHNRFRNYKIEHDHTKESIIILTDEYEKIKPIMKKDIENKYHVLKTFKDEQWKMVIM